jgi:hypothetical protein
MEYSGIERLYEVFNKVNGTNLVLENKAKAEKILTSKRISLTDPNYLALKDKLINRNQIGYLGAFVGLIYGDYYDTISVRYDVINNLYDTYLNNRNFTKELYKPLEDHTSLSELERDVAFTDKKLRVKKFANEKIFSKALKQNIIYGVSTLPDLASQLFNTLEKLDSYGEEVTNAYLKKSNKFTTPMQFMGHLEGMVASIQSGFTLNDIKQQVQGTTDAKITFEDQEHELLVVNVESYSAISKLGAKMWCFSDSESEWDRHVTDTGYTQYIIYDFNKLASEGLSMVGVTIDADGNAKYCHDRFDTALDFERLAVLDLIPVSAYKHEQGHEIISESNNITKIDTANINEAMNKKERMYDLFNKVNGTKILLENVENNKELAKAQFYKENNIDPEELSYLGQGDFGTAYSIGDGRVLKITSSRSEFNIAKQLEGKHVPAVEGFADVYKTAIVANEMWIILEELDEDSSIEDMFYELQSHLEDQGLPMQYLDNLDVDALDLSDDLVSFISDIHDINYGYRYLGIEASDLRPENMGMDKNGKVKAFDIEDRARNRH